MGINPKVSGFLPGGQHQELKVRTRLPRAVLQIATVSTVYHTPGTHSVVVVVKIGHTTNQCWNEKTGYVKG